jgi:hypothetical protein
VFPTARLPSVCAACTQAGALEVGQSIDGGKLTWFERFTCACGHGFEAGGVGLPTPAVRAALLAQAGTAELWLDDAAALGVMTTLLMRLAGLSAGDAQARLATLPACVYEGTHAEVAFFLAALEKNGLTARVVHRMAPHGG